MNAKMMIIAIGVIVGLVISIFVLKSINKDGKVKSEYDEMQKLARGKAYQYGFWTMVACEVLLCVLTSGDLCLPFDGYSLHFTVIIIGVLVQVSFCIWNDAYVGLNNSKSRLAVVSIIVALINFVFAGLHIAHGTMLVDNELQFPFINLLVGLMFIVIGLELLIKKVADNGQKED